MRSPEDNARIALACLDLTSLNDSETPGDIETLCLRAQGACGSVAAVCVWPRVAAFARSLLPGPVAVAAVANFPDGGNDIDRALRDTHEIVAAGAEEVDLVMPWRHLDDAAPLLQAVRKASEGLLLKVILETGELQDPAHIRRAASIALDAGADFLKTSTGKAPVNATLDAAALLLQAIQEGGHTRVGFKAAGGIRSVADAGAYIALAEQHLGEVTPRRFRIGASALLDDIEAVLGGSAAAPSSGY